MTETPESRQEAQDIGPDIEPSGEFVREVEQATGESLGACFQCRKCTCGCPLQADFDCQPNQIIRLIQFGQRDEVLRSKAIWLCVSCETCTSRCPNGVDLAHVMDWLRFTALAEGIEPAEPRIAQFHKAFIETLHKYGRSHELDMIRRYKMKSGTYFDDMVMGFEMFKKGKIKILGKKVDNLQTVRDLMDRYGGQNNK